VDEREMETALNDLFAELILEADCQEYPEDLPEELAGVEMVRTFEEAGILTYNKGLVLRMKDGGEFQITVVRSN
jgi:hypothetical protein